MYTALSNVLENHFSNGLASIKLMEQIIIGLIQVRDVNLTQLALTLVGKGTSTSLYRKLQRFFSSFDMSYEELARLLVKLAGITSHKWILAIDRTNWKFGKLDINIMVLSICHGSIAIPILWEMLPKAGLSNHSERQHLMERFLRIFGVVKIASLLGDREFMGDIWLQFLADHAIPFYVRIKENLTISRSKEEHITANALIRAIKKGEHKIVKGKVYLGRNYKGPLVSIAALRNEEGELVIIATNDDPTMALHTYKKRWEIETLFGCLKTRGFNFENTHLVHLDRISKLLGFLAITFTFAYIVGIWKNTVTPITLKKHGKKATSLFRYGLDYLRRMTLNLHIMKAELEQLITMFITPLLSKTFITLSP